MNVSSVGRLCLALSFAVGFAAAAVHTAQGQIFRRPQGRPAAAKPGATKPDVAKPATANPVVEELGIIVPGDEKPFGVDRTDVVRLPARGIAGSEFSTKIEGPARLRRKAYITQMFDGEFPIGGADVELEFEMTGPGKVKIDVIVNYPNGPKPKVTTYRFEVAEPRDPGVQ